MMSNNTKRDVLKDVVNTLHVMDGAPDDYCKKLIDRYDAALPDDVPMIPEYVADYINYMKSRGRDIWDAIYYPYRSNDISEYMEDNSETFARAWLDGYQVEADNE